MHSKWIDQKFSCEKEIKAIKLYLLDKTVKDIYESLKPRGYIWIKPFIEKVLWINKKNIQLVVLKWTLWVLKNLTIFVLEIYTENVILHTWSLSNRCFNKDNLINVILW